MSAFIVSDNHIHAIVGYAVEHKFDYLTFRGEEIDIKTAPGRNRLGQILLDANYRSVNFRYRESDPAHDYKFRAPAKQLTAVEFLKALRCLDYQCCEVDDWNGSDVDRLLHALADRAYYQLPGYEQAPWGIG